MICKTKKIAYIVISVLLVFSILSLFNYSAEGNLKTLKQWSGEQILSEGTSHGYILSENEDNKAVYKSIVSSSHILLSFEEQTFNTVIVTLSEAPEKNPSAKLFYNTEPSSIFSGDEYIKSYAVDDGQTLFFQTYDEAITSDSIAFNFDDEFSIESISVYNIDGGSARLEISYIALAVLLILLLVLLITEKRFGYFAWIRKGIRNELDLLAELRQGKRLAYLTHLGAVVFSALLVLSISILVAIHHYSIPAIFAIFFISVFAIAFQLADRISRGYKDSAVKLFLVIAVIIGIMMCYTSPLTTHISWDDEIHFKHAYNAANPFDNDPSIAKDKLFSYQYEAERFLSDPDKFVRIIAEESELSAVYEIEGCSLYTTISYLPTIAANALGTLLGADMAKLLAICRFANLLAYTLIVYAGIKKLRGGAFIFSAVALMPSVLYLACSISYDSWLTAWMIYGFAYIISELQQPDKKIQTSDVLKILLAFFVGCSAKALYCILMLPLLFLSKEKFPSPKHAKRFRIFVVLTLVAIAAILLLPGLLSSNLYADSRGGEDVNSYEQIWYILTHPFKYARTLLWHLGNYFSFTKFNQYNSVYGFLNGYDESKNMFFGTLTTAIIMLCLFTDKKQDELYETKPMQRMKWITLFTCFAQVVFIATSMYIGFTEVGSTQIFGCQFRYLYPMLCPIFFFLRPKSSKNYFKPKTYSCIVFGGIAFTLLIGYLLTYIIYI